MAWPSGFASPLASPPALAGWPPSSLRPPTWSSWPLPWELPRAWWCECRPHGLHYMTKTGGHLCLTGLELQSHPWCTTGSKGWRLNLRTLALIIVAFIRPPQWLSSSCPASPASPERCPSLRCKHLHLSVCPTSLCTLLAPERLPRPACTWTCAPLCLRLDVCPTLLCPCAATCRLWSCSSTSPWKNSKTPDSMVKRLTATLRFPFSAACCSCGCWTRRCVALVSLLHPRMTQGKGVWVWMKSAMPLGSVCALPYPVSLGLISFLGLSCERRSTWLLMTSSLPTWTPSKRLRWWWKQSTG